MQMESSNFSPIRVGLGIFAVFSWSLFHRLSSSTFVGRVRSQNNFRTSSTELINVLTRLVMLGMGADMIRVWVVFDSSSGQYSYLVVP